MGKRGGGEEKALHLFRFHLSPFPPETPDTQARKYTKLWKTLFNIQHTK